MTKSSWGWLLALTLAATFIAAVAPLDRDWRVEEVIRQTDLATTKVRNWIENIEIAMTDVRNGIENMAFMKARVHSWIGNMAFTFLILYALFGLGEVARHFPSAWRRLVARWRNREFGQMPKSAYGMLVAIGPLYIAIEVFRDTTRSL
ncbi:hypothetical protein [Bradyrhizobium genosp. A]|uniref:hypothetical protein n=1 Tax=Bradyrhizobium genosp. A TaxID=83626 RepID=UPI003CF65095